MRIFGLEITRTKAARTLSSVDSRGWWPLTFDRFGGEWQADVEVNHDSVIAQTTVFSCITLIAGDIGKLRLKLTVQDGEIWPETTSPAFSPVLRKPNNYQIRQQFIEHWIISKLSHGNTYVLKARDNRGVVTSLHILDPSRVQPLVANDGSVYYQLQEDNLSQVPAGLPAIPASEIIHDRMNCIFHPLIGVSPIFACGLAATQALKIGNNSAKFFQNMSRPSGMLTAANRIDDVTAERLKREWEKNYGGDNLGRVAVLGDGLNYQPMTVNPVDAQLVQQLDLSAKQVCATFHVPAYMVGAEPPPAYNNIGALKQEYYDRCLQKLIEALESNLDEGLGLFSVPGRTLGTEFDLDGLLRMDAATMSDTLSKSVGGGWMAPNEARAKANLPAVAGGDTPYLQQQNFSLSALAKRDAQSDPFGAAKPAAAPAPPAPPADAAAAKQMHKAIEVMKRGFANV